MTAEQQQLTAGIQAFEAQRALLGDTVVDMAVAALQAKLAALQGGQPASAPITPVTPTTSATLATSATPSKQALKQVSILCLDVVGSTKLIQRLDPETVGALMDGALARGTQMVEAHGGKVLRYAGDSILAAFGAQVSAEDDAERAVQCGLALLQLGHLGQPAQGQASQGAQESASHDPTRFDVRVGIHTGGVLLGGGVQAGGNIVGHAVHIATRMEQTAPPGALRISHDTYAQVRGLFEVQALEPMQVADVATPVQSYVVLRAKPRSFRINQRGIEGVSPRMIGRDAELDVLQEAFMRLYSERKLAAVTVVAEAGIGKSRLLYEFAAWAEARPERFLLFRGRTTPQTSTLAFGLLRDLLAWRFQILDDDSIEAARQKMEDGIVPLFTQDDGPDVAQAHAHLLGHLIGIDWRSSRHIKGILDDPKQLRNRAFHAAAQLFSRLSASHARSAGQTDSSTPVIVQLEDLHWADKESLDFLNYLAEVNRDMPLLLLAFTRPTLFERQAEWFTATDVHQRIELTPLDKTGSRMLADELLQRLPQVPAALRELLTSSAEGNPFYMEELMRMLIDQGAIQTHPGNGTAWKVNAERLLLTSVPPTLTGVLQARLDDLPAPERRALQQASVVGAVFWDQALQAIDPQAGAQLRALTQRELTLPKADAPLHGPREYAFRHQLLHQVTYDTVLKHDKRQWHARVAQWLANLGAQRALGGRRQQDTPGGLRAGDFLGVAAEHYERAGDFDNAVEFHARAAEQAAQRLAHDRVLAHVAQALALLRPAAPAPSPASPTQTAQRWRLLKARELTLDLQARRDEQIADLQAMNLLADLLGSQSQRAYVAYRHSHCAMRKADYGTMASAARQAVDAAAAAAAAGDDSLRLLAQRQLAQAQVYLGQIERGRALGLQALAESRSLGLRRVEASLLGMLSIVAYRQGDLLGGLVLTRQSIDSQRETGDRVAEAVSLSNLGEAWMRLGDFKQAKRDLEAALQMLRANGDRAMEAWVLSLQSALALLLGEEPRALALARSALDMAVAAQARSIAAIAALKLGNAELALGRLPAARQAFEQTKARALEIDHPTQFDACAGLARVAMAMGDNLAAVAALQPLLQYTAAGGKLDGAEDSRLIELTCYQALACVNDPQSAEWLARAHGGLMEQVRAISDANDGNSAALRHGLLHNIPHHRQIVAAWQAQPSQP